jgi:hypothetical protein
LRTDIQDHINGGGFVSSSGSLNKSNSILGMINLFNFLVRKVILHKV